MRETWPNIIDEALRNATYAAIGWWEPDAANLLKAQMAILLVAGMGRKLHSSGRSALANAHAQPRASVAAFDPRDTSNPERIGERRLELERLPVHHWI